MNIMLCGKCIYNDGMRADGTYKCCTSERQRTATEDQDCFIEAKPLREKQTLASSAEQYIFATQAYIADAKAKSTYWRRFAKKDNA